MKSTTKFLYIAVLLTVIHASSAQNIVVTAPNLLRLGVKETIGISISNYVQPVPVTVQLVDHPGKATSLAQETTTVQQGQSKIVELFLDPKKLPKSQNSDQLIYVNLIVTTNGNVFPRKEVTIPVINYGGYVFVQTDKPLYLPTQPVNIRIIYLNEQLLPVNKPFTLEITNPKMTRVLKKEMLPHPDGITETNFQLPPIPACGNWSVAVNYGHQFSGQSKVQFMVEDYVLPTFSIKINPPQVILDDQRHIVGNVEAFYVYGKPVEGFTYLAFKVRNRQGTTITIGSLRDIQLHKGKSIFSLRVQDIRTPKLKWFPDIEGSQFMIEATVVEAATGKSSSAMDDTTIFTRSPYTVSLNASMREFKPGVPYQIVVDVHYINKQRIKEPIHVEITQARARKSGNRYRSLPRKDPILIGDIGRAVFSLDTEFTDEQLEITVRTKDEALPLSKQASASITVTRYISPVPNTYVWVATPHQGTVFRVGSPFETKVHVSSGNTKSVHYMVVSKGRIVLINETYTQDALIRAIEFILTADMVPSFRLIVYVIKDNKIIADSVLIEVARTCKYNTGKEFSIQASTSAGSYHPGQDVRFKIKGEPLSKVGVVAVDEAVYILNKQDLLSQDKMFHEMQKHDLGNGPGGGINPANVFRNAGLQVLSNAHIDDHRRQVAGNRRKKRSLQDIVDKYTGDARKCCTLGRSEGKPDMNCTTRAAKIYDEIKDDLNCSKAFLECCIATFENPYGSQSSSLLGRATGINGEENPDVKILIETVEHDVLSNIRRIFPETWFFKTYTIGGDKNCGGTDRSICEVKYSAPHSITSWIVQAVAVSTTTGMCVAKPLKIQVFKPMFIQLHLPTSAVRGEQIEVMATIFNYGDTTLNVTTYMFGVEGICMGAGPGERSGFQTVEVRGNDAVSVFFPIMPLHLGEFPIKVVGLSWSSSDAIEKTLKIVSEGVPLENTITLTLDPSGFYHKQRQEQHDRNIIEMYDERTRKQTFQITLSLPQNHIPDTERCYISLTGNNLGHSVNTSVSGLKDFLQVPTGCGEQTMIHMAPLVYTMTYLRGTNQMTSEIEKSGYDYLWKGYAHALVYRKDDGSFAVWKTHQSSTWLTAFSVKILCQSKTFINVASEHMCMGVDWLGKQQNAAGAFFDAYKVHHREMTGGVQGEATLTAFVLISMTECSSCQSAGKTHAVRQATKFLEAQIPHLRRPYAIALVAYALSLVKSDQAIRANEKLKQISIFHEATYERFWNLDASEFNNGQKPWVYQHHPSAVAVETTAYALLTQLVHNDVGYSHAIVNWLNKQRSSKGSFISTQDTVIALQALAQYNLKAKLPQLDMVVHVSSAASGRKKTYILKPENAFVVLEDEVPTNAKLYIDVTGKGLATMSVVLRYNVEQSPEKTCKFELTVTSEEFNDTIKPSVIRPELENQVNFLSNRTLEAILSVNVLRSQLGYEVDADAENQQPAGAPNAQGEKKHVVKLNICTRFLENRNAGMSILDVKLLTGYSVLPEDLEELKRNQRVTQVSEYEVKQQSIILYLDEVPFNKKLCISFRTARSVTVGLVQPTPVKVYDFYEPDKSCTKFYGPAKNSTMLKKICEKRQCICLEGLCPSCYPFKHIRELQKDMDRRTELLNMACDQHDYVWNGTLVDAYKNESFQYYKYKVLHVMKAGTQKKEELINEIVTLTARDSCPCPRMDVGKVYIVMGQDGRPIVTEDGETKFKYIIDKKTSIYNSRSLREFSINDTKGKNLQKAMNTLFLRLVERDEGCVH